MSVEGVHRPAVAEISGSAIAHNVRAMKVVVGEAMVCAVVKANGYGHGALASANAALEGGASWLAVAILDEGIELRSAGITAPILLLAETPPETVAEAMAHSLTLTIGSLAGAVAAVEAAKHAGGRHGVHVKVDTGMHRMGVAEQDVEQVVDVLLAAPEIDFEGLYTHFSVADSASAGDRQFTRQQIERFDAVVAKLAARDVHPRLVHAANSAGALAYPEARHHLVRLGLSLYGYLPQPWLAGALEESGVTLRPALTLRTRVSALRRVGVGEAPSYGRKRPLDVDSWVATIPFGYADGYPRRLFREGAEVLIGGRRYCLAGNVTMDQIVVDCAQDEVGIGAEVVLLGRQGAEEITADEWAQRVGTITWEILCGVGARVPRVLVD
ncbi:MAG TPA: alanine racemase [Acidimicrobiales bacterium]|nr:alanine racemase [Acidimicrobiales bacterium]